MRIKRVLLRGFRNLERIDISPHHSLNVIFGVNGSGKTNFCEALYFASTGNTLKGSRQRELIGWNLSGCLIRLTLEGNDTLSLQLEKGQSKQLEINSKAAKQSEARSLAPVLVFTPDDLYILKGGPAKRRELLDVHLGALDPEYSRVLDQYHGELKKKNALLKKTQPNKEFLQVLNQRMVESGATIAYHRAKFIQKLNERLPENYQAIAGETNRSLKINYTDLPKLDMSEEEIAGELKREMKQNWGKERELETSVVGPHRDKIRYELEGHNLRKFGSQGEQRSATIATKLAILSLYNQVLEEWPVLLLDDILSELDPNRAKALLNNLPSGPQVFLTSTENGQLIERLGASLSAFQIKNGSLENHGR